MAGRGEKEAEWRGAAGTAAAGPARHRRPAAQLPREKCGIKEKPQEMLQPGGSFERENYTLDVIYLCICLSTPFQPYRAGAGAARASPGRSHDRVLVMV